VVYNAKEAKLRKLRKWLFGIPILLGTIFSASSIPFIQTGVVGCQISPPMPLATTEVLRELGLPYLYWPFIWFMIVPGYTAIFYSTMITLYMLYRMKKVDQRSKKWVMSQVHESQKRSAKHPITALTKLRGEVFLQCFQYLVAVYITWLLFLTVMIQSKHLIMGHFGLWILFYFLVSIQGFLNCLVYFRPRIVRYWRTWKKKKCGNSKHQDNLPAAMTEPSSKPTGDSTETWNRIAEIEPAVDIIAENEIRNDRSSLEHGNDDEFIEMKNSVRDDDSMVMQNGKLRHIHQPYVMKQTSHCNCSKVM
jgi:hypothetical protein